MWSKTKKTDRSPLVFGLKDSTCSKCSLISGRFMRHWPGTLPRFNLGLLTKIGFDKVGVWNKLSILDCGLFHQTQIFMWIFQLVSKKFALKFACLLSAHFLAHLLGRCTFIGWGGGRKEQKKRWAHASFKCSERHRWRPVVLQVVKWYYKVLACVSIYWPQDRHIVSEESRGKLQRQQLQQLKTFVKAPNSQSVCVLNNESGCRNYINGTGRLWVLFRDNCG